MQPVQQEKLVKPEQLELPVKLELLDLQEPPVSLVVPEQVERWELLERLVQQDLLVILEAVVRQEPLELLELRELRDHQVKQVKLVYQVQLAHLEQPVLRASLEIPEQLEQLVPPEMLALQDHLDLLETLEIRDHRVLLEELERLDSLVHRVEVGRQERQV